MADDVEYNLLNDRQEKVLSLLYVISSFLSIVGSATIIYKVLSDRRHATSYDRLMLGLSTCDLIASVGYALNPFLLPRDTSIRVWAVGSDASCTFLGFMTQFGFSAVLYNAFLSFYYLFTVRYGIERRRFAKRYEAWLHAITFIFSLTTASVGGAMGFYSEVQVGFGCWVNNYPKGCFDECISEEIAWFYGTTPIFFTLVSLIVNNILVYLHVRRVFRTTDVEFERTIRQKIQKREVATQGLLYVATFLFCYWSPMFVRAVEAFNHGPVDETKIYWVLVFMSAAFPLQGFLNMFVYNLPNYKRVRAAYPHLSTTAAIRVACLDPTIPKLTSISSLSILSKASSRKYNRKVQSASAFSSGLAKIREESGEAESDEGSSMYDQARGTLLNSVEGTIGERNDGDDPQQQQKNNPFTEKNSFGTSDVDQVHEIENDSADADITRPRFRRTEMDGSVCDNGDNGEGILQSK